MLFDEGALVRDGAAVRLAKPLDELKIPPTVQAILAARIDRLPPDEKELLQTLAVIGKEFPLGAHPRGRAAIRRRTQADARDLQLAEFIYEQPAVGDIEYTFKHALTQEVAYGSVLVERRRALHVRIGVALEALYRNGSTIGSNSSHITSLAAATRRRRWSTSSVPVIEPKNALPTLRL